MADVLNRLVASRYAELARRAFGEDITVDSFAPELLATVVMELDPLALRIHKGEFLAVAYSTAILAGAAGNVSSFQLFNPARSGLVATAEGGFVRTTAGVSVSYRLDVAALGSAAGNEALRDSRPKLWGTSPALTIVGNGFNAGGLTPGGALLWRQSVTAATYTSMNIPPFVLGPSAGLTVHDDTAAEIFEAAFFFSFRVARPEELGA